MYALVADIERLINAVKAAPSVLNTQPWLFQIVADDRINLRAQCDRGLRMLIQRNVSSSSAAERRCLTSAWRCGSPGMTAWSG